MCASHVHRLVLKDMLLLVPSAHSCLRVHASTMLVHTWEHRTAGADLSVAAEEHALHSATDKGVQTPTERRRSFSHATWSSADAEIGGVCKVVGLPRS